jgi:hypothetical protein
MKYFLLTLLASLSVHAQEKPKIAAFALFNMQSQFAIENGSSSLAGLNSFSGTASGTYGYGVGVEAISAPDRQLGYSFGLGYEFGRSIDGQVVNGTASTFNPKASASVLFIYGGAQYAIGEHRFFGGINFPFPSITGFTSQLDWKGAVGYQIGVARDFTPEHAAEFLYQVLAFKATGSSPTQSFDASVKGIVLRYKYTFQN